MSSSYLASSSSPAASSPPKTTSGPTNTKNHFLGLTQSGGWSFSAEHHPPKPFRLIIPSTPVSKELLEPYKYVAALEGKGVRTMLMRAFNDFLKIKEEDMMTIAEMVGVLHNASLMVDDIEDGSRLRRGVPVCHSIFGIPNTINTANYMYFLAMQKVHNFGGAQATSVFLEELLNLHRGQGYDIYWRDNNTCPTEEEYRGMVLDKTGGLFRLALRLMQVFSEDKNDYLPLVNMLGLYYQIRDDYLNLKSDEYQKNKSFAEDLTEGKFSYPIIHSIRSNPADHRLLNILKRRTSDEDVKRHAITYMEQTGSFEYTRQVLKELGEKIHAQIEELGGNEKLTELMKLLETINPTAVPSAVSSSEGGAFSVSNESVSRTEAS